MNYQLKSLLFCLLTTTLGYAQTLKFPVIQQEVLKAKYELEYWGKLELSGIVKSRADKNVFWVHNDSGDEPRLFALDSTGNFYPSHRYKNYEGVSIAGATNVDWEDITTDNKGNLIVADIGNNGNDRRDLLLYVIPEPPASASNTTFLKKIFIKYPDQKAFPDKEDFNYDSEGIFFANNHIYVLSKNRSNTNTKLYRLDQENSEAVNSLTYIDQFDINGQVTAADASVDGKKLVLITYTAIWIFEKTTADSSYFDGSIWWLPVKAPQIESVCFKNNNTLWLLDEVTASIYEVPLGKLVKIK